MDFHEKTIEYYSMWLGEDHILGKEAPGVYPVYSAERNKETGGKGWVYGVCRGADRHSVRGIPALSAS